MVANTRGVVFFSVPHAGSPIADFFERPRVPFYTSSEALELCSGNQIVMDI